MTSTLREQQFAFARHLRDPSRNPKPPGIDDRRMKVYRDLFFNSLQSQLASGFPVIRQTLQQEAWLKRVRDFYADYRSQTPLFTEIAGEFVGYLQGRSDDPEWLAELAHYEWMETKLHLSDAVIPKHDPEGDVIDGVPALSPLAMPLAYRWPVTHIGPASMPTEAPEQPTLLLLHRAANHRVQFKQISPAIYRLAVSLASNEWTGRSHLAALAAEARLPEDALIEPGRGMLEQLRRDGIVLGTLP
ncbi:MAG TPA: putative DNA-binding domain-containing protein [Steroidobacter sp.]